MRRNDVVVTGELRHRVSYVDKYKAADGAVEAGKFDCGQLFRYGKNYATVRRTFPTCLGCVAMEDR